MKKIITLIMLLFITFSFSFASYTIRYEDKQKVEFIVNKIYNIVEKKYKTKSKRNYIYQSIVDTIDGYLVLHKVSERNKVILLYLKTLLLKHIWYKIWDCKELKVVK